jgi:thymidylate synthase
VKAKSLLNIRGIAFRESVIGEDILREDFTASFPDVRTAPFIIIDGVKIGGFDQLKWVVDRIKEDHSCRRTLWTLWNPQDVDQMRLPPCHMMFQVLVDDERRLTGIMYQRSCDFPIGVPANIQFYSALTIMLAQQTGCTPFEFVHVTADSHIYENQIDGVRAYLEAPIVDSPSLVINKATDIFSYKPEDFVVSNFNSGPKIDIPVAV